MTNKKGICYNTGRTHFKKGQIPWNKGLTKETDSRVNKQYTEKRNKKISKANKGNHNCGKSGKHYYKHICKICKRKFVSKRPSRTICNNKNCQNAKGKNRIINKITEYNRRKKISKKLKGKIPKNLYMRVKSNKSIPQIKMFKKIKKIFSNAKYDYHVETKKTHRFIDVAIPDKKLGFEYNGKIHLMKNIKIRDKQRLKELKELGWKIMIFDKNNIKYLDYLLEKKKEENTDIF